MYKERRQALIKDYLDQHQQVDVKQLAQEFNVSEMTIRRDLNTLDERGFLKRTHGGAINHDAYPSTAFQKILNRIDLQKDEKQAIGQYVASLVKPGATIYIGAGTTAYWVAKNVFSIRDLTVVSNSLLIANLISQNDYINLIMVGGYLRRREYTFIGRLAEVTMQDLHFDMVIVGMDGIHPDYGLTSHHPPELMTDRTFLSMSDNVLVVADHTKIGYVSTHKTADITSVRSIVTTHKAPADIVAAIREKGCKVTLL